MSHPTDYITKFPIFEKTIIEKADELRKEIDQEHDTAISPLPALRRYLRVPVGKKGTLTIHPVEMPDGAPPARVKYNPLRLFIDREILSEAERYNDPKANEIIAHELGHVIFHDHEAKDFSESDAERIKSFTKDYSAECHAETFADNYLLPLKYVIAFGLKTSDISNNCNVIEAMALRQIERARRLYKIVSTPCGECGQNTLSRTKGKLTCLSCHAIYHL
jgi:hypothetical protein